MRDQSILNQFDSGAGGFDPVYFPLSCGGLHRTFGLEVSHKMSEIDEGRGRFTSARSVTEGRGNATVDENQLSTAIE